VSNNMPPLKSAFWLLVVLGAVPALIYLIAVVQSGVRGEAFVQPVYFQGYYGFGFILVFVCIAWLAQQLDIWWGIFLGLPALFIGIYPAMENFGSEKLVSGAVVAFDRDDCPPGWNNYKNANARVIVGAGEASSPDEQQRALTIRKRGRIGGEEVHKLTIAEMPNHNHNPDKNFNLLLKSDSNFTLMNADQTGGEPNLHVAGVIEARGSDQPHNIMPPFIV
jgi:hypothetical protein